MKQKLISDLRGLVILTLTAGFVSLPALSATISVQPSSLPIVGAKSFSLSISISGAVDLYAYQFDLGFNPSVLSATGVTEGPFLATGGATFFIAGAIDNGGGEITFTANTLLSAVSGVSGGGILATVTFNSIANGTSPITLFNTTLLDSTLSGISTTSQNGSVTVSGIPEPSSGFLLGAGLLLSWALRTYDPKRQRGDWAPASQSPR